MGDSKKLTKKTHFYDLCAGGRAGGECAHSTFHHRQFTAFATMALILILKYSIEVLTHFELKLRLQWNQ